MSETYLSNKEALAEAHVLELINNLARSTEDAIRETLSLLEEFAKGKLEIVRVKYSRIRTFKNRSEELKSKTLEYLVRTGPSMLFKDIYVSIAYNLERIAQLMNGISHRLLLLSLKGLTPSVDVAKRLVSFGEKFIEEYEGLKRTLIMMNYNPKKVIEGAREVFRLEDEIDDMYRSNEVELYEKHSSNLILLMLLKEVYDIIEESSDLVKDSAENLAYLALHKIP